MPDFRSARPEERYLRARISSQRNDPPSRLVTQAQLAKHWKKTGDYRRASLLLSFTLAAAENVHGVKSLEVARLCNQSGVLGKYTGNFDHSQRLYIRALMILRRELGPDHDSVATIYHNLGGLEHSRGNPELGEPWAAWSVEVRERLHGPDHPLVAADLAAWAPLLVGCGRLEEAEIQLQRALKIFEAVGDDYERAVTLHNMAALQHARGADREALAGYVQALVVKECVLGAHHPDLATSLVNLAGVCRRVGELDRAQRYLSRAVRILTPQVSSGHPTLAAARRGLDSLSR
ncbi:tetratricopeptide repeat protein [Streptomyces sp. NPDC056534]|uniref:tetratricopeptide repeat protein n=1 Tax=Streptomyces sp. NPDC056534 TaxID=3345857 RepID=UPI00367E3062